MAETFGKITKGLTTFGSTPNCWLACKFTSGSAGSLASIGVYISTGASGNAKCAIYDSGLSPLANGGTEELSITGKDEWMTFNFPTPPTVEASTIYWLFVWTNANYTLYYDAGGTNQWCYDYPGPTYNSLPDPLEPTKYEDKECSIYATYEEAPTARIPKLIMVQYSPIAKKNGIYRRLKNLQVSSKKLWLPTPSVCVPKGIMVQ